MLQSSPINVSDFSVFCALNFGVKKCRNHFVNSMMQRMGQKVIKVVNKNSHADVWQKCWSYSNLAVKLIRIKQKRKYHFILPGRSREGNQFWFPISISRDFCHLLWWKQDLHISFLSEQQTQIHLLSFAFQIMQHGIFCTLKKVKSKVFTFVTCKLISCSLTHFRETCFLKGLEQLLCNSSTPVAVVGPVLIQCL